MLQDLADDWILDPGLEPALAAMVEAGLAFDALVRPRHLPSLRELIRRWPGLRVVIDHGGKPDIGAGDWTPGASRSPPWPSSRACTASFPAC